MFQYDILAGESAIGQAQVEQQGLYLSIKCRCRLPDNNIHRVIMTANGIQYDLGVCIPMNGQFGINTKLSTKGVNPGCLQFHLTGKKTNKQECFEPLNAQEQYPFLDKLDNGTFAVREGIPGIVFND